MNCKTPFLVFMVSFISLTSCMDSVQLAQDIALNYHSNVSDILEKLLNNASTMIAAENDKKSLYEFNQTLEKFNSFKADMHEETNSVNIFFDLRHLLKINTEFVVCMSEIIDQKPDAECLKKHFFYIGLLTTMNDLAKPYKKIIQQNSRRLGFQSYEELRYAQESFKKEKECA